MAASDFCDPGVAVEPSWHRMYERIAERPTGTDTTPGMEKSEGPGTDAVPSPLLFKRLRKE
jgi:hypothetical protein